MTEQDIPFELDYTLENNYNIFSKKIDWTALEYDFWNKTEFWASRFPSGLLLQFPELMEEAEKAAERCKKNGITPLTQLGK